VLPVNGSREALFALAQVVVNPRAFAQGTEPVVVCPNPFYQIYEGAAYLAGAQPWFAPSDPARNFAVDWASVPAAVWERTQLLYTCSPGNPTGAVMPLDEWRMLFELSDRYGFVIASDECYSEIYFRDEPPLGGLQAAAQLGRGDFRRLIALTSLSKRSNVPGLRSGFVAGDAELIRQFLLYRTYHGSAMSTVVQAASAAAWLRRAACGREPGPVPHQVRPGHAHPGPGDERATARCRLLPVGRSAAGLWRHAGRQRHRLRARVAGPIQCHGAARQLPGARSARPQPGCRAACAWPWWPKPPNAKKPRGDCRIHPETPSFFPLNPFRP
jgi:DNA-binding transcriptional MocR family regulator